MVKIKKIDLNDITGFLFICSLCLTLLIIFTLIYLRYKHDIKQKWMYCNLVISIIIFSAIYIFQNIAVQIPLFSLLICVYVIIINSWDDNVEIFLTNEIITKYLNEYEDIESNHKRQDNSNSNSNPNSNTSLSNPVYYDPFSPIYIPNN